MDEELDAFIRDITSVEFMSKSEVRDRTAELLSFHREDVIEEVRAGLSVIPLTEDVIVYRDNVFKALKEL